MNRFLHRGMISLVILLLNFQTNTLQLTEVEIVNTENKEEGACYFHLKR